MSCRTAILNWSNSSHLPIWVAASILTKNSSIEHTESKPDHFGRRKTNDKFLWTVDGPPDRRFSSRRISAIDSCNSSCKCASATLNLKVRTKYIPKRFGFYFPSGVYWNFSTNNLVHVFSWVQISNQYIFQNVACGKWSNPTAANQFVVPPCKSTTILLPRWHWVELYYQNSYYMKDCIHVHFAATSNIC